MIIKGIFLGISAESFKNKETGETVQYSRLHVFDPAVHEYYKLPIRGDIAERKEDIELYSEVEIPVGQRDTKTGGKELAVITWD